MTSADRTPALPARAALTDAQRFLLLSALVGVCAGLLVVCFHASIELIAWAVEDGGTTPWTRVLVAGGGAAAAALLVKYGVPSAAGSGIVQTKSALYVSNGHIPVSSVPGKFVACSISIGTGTPLGPEDPSLLMGAGMASWLGRTLGLSQRLMRMVAPIGAAAGIAAAFNTPITGVLFVVEEVLAAWDATVLGSIVLAAVSAVVTTRMFLGDALLFQVPELSAAVSPRDVLLYAVLGTAAGLFATAYVHGVAFVRRRIGRSSIAPGVAPFLAGSLAGAIGLWLPEVLGPGYRAMDAALHGQYAWTTLALLGLAKLAIAAAAFGAGVPGGLFAPTLFLGVMLGGTVGALAPQVLPFDANPGSAYVLAGMVGVFAGVFRAPMTAIFMGFELSATSAIIVPAMITSTLGYLTARQLHRQSILDLVAEDEGAILPSARAEREAEPLRIETAMRSSRFLLFEHTAKVADVVEALTTATDSTPMLVHTPSGWYEVDRNALGSADGVSAAAGPIGEHPSLRSVTVVHPDEPLDTALRHLSRCTVIPVVSRLSERGLLGVVTLAAVHRAYGLAHMSAGESLPVAEPLP